MEYTSKDEIAVCNLASIALPMFVEEGKFNHDKLFDVTKRVTKNLNRGIDRNYYPVKEAENSNMRHRPVGLGVQGLADTFIKLRLPFQRSQWCEPTAYAATLHLTKPAQHLGACP